MRTRCAVNSYVHCLCCLQLQELSYAVVHHTILRERVASGSELTNFRYHSPILIRSSKYLNNIAKVILKFRFLGIYTGSVNSRADIAVRRVRSQSYDTGTRRQLYEANMPAAVSLSLRTYLITYSIAQSFLRI